jgi:hypothetical protein
VTRYSDIPKPIRSGIVLIDPERGTPQRIIVLGILFQLRTMRLLFSGPTTTRRRVVLNSTPAQISITPMVDDGFLVTSAGYSTRRMSHPWTPQRLSDLPWLRKADRLTSRAFCCLG